MIRIVALPVAAAAATLCLVKWSPCPSTCGSSPATFEESYLVEVVVEEDDDATAYERLDDAHLSALQWVKQGRRHTLTLPMFNARAPDGEERGRLAVVERVSSMTEGVSVESHALDTQDPCLPVLTVSVSAEEALSAAEYRFVWRGRAEDGSALRQLVTVSGRSSITPTP